MIQTVVRFIASFGVRRAVQKFGKVLVDKAKTFMRANPNTVAKMKSKVDQTPVEKLPMFKKLSNRYVSEGVNFKGLDKGKPKYNFEGLTKGNDISKGM
tara:strand:+ start:581 stop:874 length:294 start_codon:yes stop_codon:yes gene_type:complete